MKHCSWCDTEFNSDISYQIYCSSTCREDATKQKIAQRYIVTRRQKRKGKVRSCKQCGSQLSIYNDDSLCVLCNVNPSTVEKALKEIKGKSNGKK
jgi:uncharacterized protein YmfQ (DUF2313 family)